LTRRYPADTARYRKITAGNFENKRRYQNLIPDRNLTEVIQGSC
jgi:hypothetical protein